MKSLASVVLTLAATTDAASLRSKATTRTLSNMQLAAVQKMATKYDCHDASGDVVTTLQNIVRKNDAEGNRLAAECEGFKTTYATAWTAAKAKYDTDFPQVAIDANAAYDAATIAKNTAYTTATTALETRFNDVEAEWQTTEPLGTRISAVKTPMTTATTTHDTAVASEATALADKIAAIGTMAEDGVDGTATIQKATSLGVCTTLLNERQAHISSDVELLDKMEPLLKQLKICDGRAHETTGESNSKLLSLVEVDTRAKCALTKKSMMSLLEVSGIPTGSFADFKARVITETTYMNKEKTTCDGEANTAYTNVVTHHTSLWNAAKTLTEEKLAIKTSATAAYNAEVEIGEDRMRSATTAKTSEEATRDEAKTAAEILATNTKSTAITTGEAAVTLTKAEAKTSIGNDARFQANLCTEGKENLLAEAALVRQMTDILNSGGTDGSDLRVVGDDVDGNAVNMKEGSKTGDVGITGQDTMAAAADFGTVSEELASTTGDSDECAADPCQNGATCTNTINDSFSCSCLPGFTGEKCETNIDDCASNPCQNGATCVDHVNSFSCSCLPGFTGEKCETNIDECATKLCQNGAKCVDMIADYTCECPVGFGGKNCEQNIDDCAGSPCKNGATCHDGINKYTCACVGEFKGSNCETPKEPPCRTIHNPRFHGGNKACNWPNVGHTARQVCRDNGYNSVKNWHESGQRVDCYGWRGHWKHDSNPGWITSITCCK